MRILRMKIDRLEFIIIELGYSKELIQNIYEIN